jgi:hypothetical protein
LKTDQLLLVLLYCCGLISAVINYMACFNFTGATLIGTIERKIEGNFVGKYVGEHVKVRRVRERVGVQYKETGLGDNTVFWIGDDVKRVVMNSLEI